MLTATPRIAGQQGQGQQRTEQVGGLWWGGGEGGGGRRGKGGGGGASSCGGKKQPRIEQSRRELLHQPNKITRVVCLFVCCLTSQQHASVSQGRICSDNFTCCHTEIEVADPTFYLTQSQYTNTGPTSLSVDPITPGAWQGSHWSANVYVTGMTRPRKIPAQAGFEPWIFRSRGGRLNH